MPDNHYIHSRLAQVYDVSDQPYPAEKTFYLSLAGAPPRKVLDLGCGVGNLCHGFRENGHEVTGVDPAPAMLDVAAAKPGGAAIKWITCDAQSFRSDERFDLIIMTGHAFQVLLNDEDIQATLKTMRDHIAQDGTLAFESRNPEIDWVTRWTARPDTVWELNPRETVSISTHVLDRSGDTISFEHHYRFPDEELVSSSTLKFTTLADLTKFLEDAGFQVEACYGDWDRSPFVPETSLEMIIVAKPGDEV